MLKIPFVDKNPAHQGFFLQKLNLILHALFSDFNPVWRAYTIFFSTYTCINYSLFLFFWCIWSVGSCISTWFHQHLEFYETMDEAKRAFG